jgi:hypothetical protein
MEWSVAPTDREKPEEVEGCDPEDLMRPQSAEPIGGQRSCNGRDDRPDT